MQSGGDARCQFLVQVKRVSQKKSCKLSSETTERRHHSSIPAFHPYQIVLSSIELVVCIFLQNIRTRITVWLWSSPTPSFSTRGQAWPYSPTFPISKIHQSLKVARRRIRRIFRCIENAFYDRVSSCTWWGMDISRGQRWEYQGYGS